MASAFAIPLFSCSRLHRGPSHTSSTPKPGWAQIDLAGMIHRQICLPVGFDTDVNAAALAEQQWGVAQGLDSFFNLTIGTGICGGGMIGGRLIQGLNHPEMGHFRFPHDSDADPFAGSCPYHGDCLEGLASGSALETRWGQDPEALFKDHPAWYLEAEYLALGLVNMICILLPQRIIMGGGIMHQGHLFPLIRHRVQALLSDNLQVPMIIDQIDNYIVPPGLGDRAGLLGAIALAQRAVNQLGTPRS
jgi:fructokinase